MALKRRFIVVKVFRALYLLALGLALLLGLTLVLLQNPGIQTWLSGKVVEKVFSRIDGDVCYEKIHIKPFNTILIRNLAIKDKHPYIPPTEVLEKLESYDGPLDTLFAAEYVIVRFSIWDLLRRNNKRLAIEKAQVKNGVFNLVIEDGRTSLERMLKLPKDRAQSYIIDTTAAALPIHIENVELDNVDYVMLNFKRQAPHFKMPGSIDWTNVHCIGVRARGKDLNIHHGVISGDLKSCSFREKCGINVSQVAAHFSIREGFVNIEDISFCDQYSQTHIPFFQMIYDGAASFTDYVHKVRMYAKLEDTVIDSRTLDFFADITGSEGLKAKLNGYFDGTVSDFQLKDMNVSLLEDSFSAHLNARATGLPFVERTRFHLDIAHLKARDTGLEKVIRVFGRQDIDLPGALIHHMDARLYGNPNNIHIQTQMQSNLGNVSLDGDVAQLVEAGKDGLISLRVQADGVRIDRLSGSDQLGTMDMMASLEVSLDKNDALNSQVAIDSIVVDKVGLLGYDYGAIDIRGQIQNKDFEGSAIIQDENLKFYFNGLATLLADESGARYHFRSGISYADLEALGLDSRGRSRMHLDIRTDVDISPNREMMGQMNIEDIHLENEVADYDLGSIQARAFMDNGLARIQVGSEMLEANFTGSRSILHFLGVSLGQILHKDDRPWDGSRYEISLQCRDTEKILAWALPGMSISNGSNIQVQVDKQGDMTGEVAWKHLMIDDVDIADAAIQIDNRDQRINARLGCREIDLGQFKVDDIDLGVWTDLRDEEQVRAGFAASQFTVGKKLWALSPSNLTISKESGIHIEDFDLRHQEESISIYGKIAAPDMSDSLYVDMNQFDLGLISGFMSSDIPAFDGSISGYALLGRRNGHYGADASITCDNGIFDNHKIGPIFINSQWEEEASFYLLTVTNSYSSKYSFNLECNYFPYTNKYNLNCDFNKFDMGTFHFFVKDIFNKVEGKLSGLVSLNGSLDNSKDLTISSSDLELTNALLGIDYTKVAYHVNSRLKVDNKGLQFIDATLKDKDGAKGKLNGSILFNDFKQLSADLHIAVDKMELLDIKEKDKDQYSFYGHIFGSGSLDITGPFNAITLDIRANTTGIASDFNLTLEGSSQNAGSSLLKFKEPEPVGKKLAVRRKVQPQPQGDMTVKLALDVTRDVTAHIDIDKFNGSRITANGNGRILIDVRPAHDVFKLNGNYEIEEGKVRFVALGLTARDFTVKNGSSVSFGGDVMETSLDIDAIYKTKASLAAIIADSTAVSSRRLIECGIKVTDKLKNPHVAFSINVPDLEPTIKTRVESAFSTEDKVQRQFLALLVTGTFIPDEQGGVQDNTAALYGNVSELMTTQLNNIFMKLDIPLDLGFNYQPSSTGTSVFDVAVSTQLFDNRVVVNGNIGSKRRMTSGGNRNEVVGDIDIEVKINRSGSLRTSAFSHSADQFTNYLDNLQRIGVGISWQQEFNHFGHYFRNLFTKRETRSILEQQEERKRRQRGSKRVTITE